MLYVSSPAFKRAGSFCSLTRSPKLSCGKFRLLCCREKPQGGALRGRYMSEKATWDIRPSPISLSGRKETKVQGSEEICPKSLWPMTRNHFLQCPGNVCSAPFHCICSWWIWGEWEFVQDPYHGPVTMLDNVRRFFLKPIFEMVPSLPLKWFLLCLYKPKELSRHHLDGSHRYY